MAANDTSTEVKVGCLYWFVDRDGKEKPVKVVSIDEAAVCIEMQPEGGGEKVTRETEGHLLHVKPQNPAAGAEIAGAAAGAAAAEFIAHAKDAEEPRRIPVPESFRCPISGEVMTDPVVDPEGNTYDRACIEQWLLRNPTSPLTRNRLTARMLKPNRALADSIATFRPMLETEEEPVPNPEVTKALEEETALRKMWIGRVTVKVKKATSLPKSDAIVVVSNGSCHCRLMPEKPEGHSSLKRATPACAGTDPVWDHELTLPVVAAATGHEDARCLTLHVKHLPVGQEWKGNDEGEWLGKVVVKLQAIKTAEGAGLDLAVPLLKKGEAVGSAQLHVLLRAEQVPYETYTEEVSQLYKPPPPPKAAKPDLLNSLMSSVGLGVAASRGDEHATAILNAGAGARLTGDMLQGVKNLFPKKK